MADKTPKYLKLNPDGVLVKCPYGWDMAAVVKASAAKFGLPEATIRTEQAKGARRVWLRPIAGKEAEFADAVQAQS